MNLVSNEINGYLANSSMIRKMFETGTLLKKQYGEDSVYDFSLGNPDLPAPEIISKTLHQLAEEANKPFAFGYMPNAGLPEARQALATFLSKEQEVSLEAADVILTCGAAGGINAFFRAVLNPQDEVIAIAPYFVEYGFYVANFQGKLVSIPAHADTFEPDLALLETAITEKTKVLLINTPNNPSGAVYSLDTLKKICTILENAEKKYNHPIYLLSDEPYRFLTYDNTTVPAMLPLYQHAVVAGSFSKSLCLPGERIGYLALSPLFADRAILMSALTLTNRILGYVNAPVVGQKLMLAGINDHVDINVYTSRRNAMAKVLTDAGITFTMPKGGFYFFPKAPNGNDKEFVNDLLEQRILGVPGSGFGFAGYFRLAFCVEEKTIRNSEPAFIETMKKYR